MASEEERRQRGTVPKHSSQPMVTEVVSKIQEYERNGKKCNRLTTAVATCIARDALPIYTVEKRGFRDMLRELDVRYTLPSHSYFSRTAIPNLYTSTRDVVSREVQNVLYFSATTDLWSSVGLKPYLSFTMHYIDEEWKLRSRCLHTSFLPEDHTGNNIAMY